MSSGFKVISLLKARADIDRAAFVNYYETRHAPLILELMPGIIAYRRNYVAKEGGFVFAGTPQFDYDSITEIWFHDRAAYEAGLEALAWPESAARLVADEEMFLDRS
ncbi:EthD domain-containing protein, partial [Sphingopyxis sp.]|uniref:EthD domain-containing protein n=1 Tax=Sphingopyxis sp. TaxID=1908224 RepID=UPI002ED91046